jgi:hypothetical protein
MKMLLKPASSLTVKAMAMSSNTSMLIRME